MIDIIDDTAARVGCAVPAACGIVLPYIHAQHGTESIFVPFILKADISGHKAEGAQDIVHLLIHVTDIIRNFNGFIMIMLQDIIQSFLGDQMLIGHLGSCAFSQYGSGYLQKGILQDLLVALHPFSDLFIKPSHSVTS